jgi:hypothetical protein
MSSEISASGDSERNLPHRGVSAFLLWFVPLCGFALGSHDTLPWLVSVSLGEEIYTMNSKLFQRSYVRVFFTPRRNRRALSCIIILCALIAAFVNVRAELSYRDTILQMENADFAGRVAVVTGAWRGLGRAAAVRLHERGASVAVNVRNRERAEALAKGNR